MIAKAHDCHTAKSTMVVHAHVELVRMLSANNGIPESILGNDVLKMNLKT